MKVNLEVECTPEEARRAMGLPDLTPVHDRYVALLTDSMEGRGGAEMLEAVMRNWAPMGEAGMNFWRKLFDASGKPGV